MKEPVIAADEPSSTHKTRISVYRMQENGSIVVPFPPSRNRSLRLTKKLQRRNTFFTWSEWEYVKITMDHWDKIQAVGKVVLPNEYYVVDDGVKSIYCAKIRNHS